MSTASAKPTAADRALLRMLGASGEAPAPGFWDAFPPDRRERLRSAWEAAGAALGPDGLDELRREHEAEARPDLRRIHPTWFLRGLREESPAVQRAVLARLEPPLREALRAGLGLAPEELRGDREPDAEALAWAMTLWTERLVGDRPERPDDPLAIVALTRLAPREGLRLVRAAGLAKWALAGLAPPRLHGRARDRFGHFEGTYRDANEAVRAWAARDVVAVRKSGTHLPARLGSVTVARLLEEAEPRRVRWALQHVPYPIAKFLRSLMPPRPRRDSSAARIESKVLKAAWDRLREEGRLSPDPGGMT